MANLGNYTPPVRGVPDADDAVTRRVEFSKVGDGDIHARVSVEFGDADSNIAELVQSELAAAAIAAGITGMQALNFLRVVYNAGAQKFVNS